MTNRDTESFWLNTETICVDERSRTSWGDGMPKADYAQPGWRHYDRTEAQWFTWNSRMGVWDGEDVYDARYWAAATAAVNVYLNVAQVPAALSGAFWRTCPHASRVVSAQGVRSTSGSNSLRLYIGGVEQAAAQITFAASASFDTTFATLIAVTGARNISARVGADASFPGGYCVWRFRRYAVSAP